MEGHGRTYGIIDRRASYWLLIQSSLLHRVVCLLLSHKNEADDTKSADTAPNIGLFHHSLYHSLSRPLPTQLFSIISSLVLRRHYQHMANSIQPVSSQDTRPPDADSTLQSVSSFGDASQHSRQKSNSPDDCPYQNQGSYKHSHIFIRMQDMSVAIPIHRTIQVFMASRRF